MSSRSTVSGIALAIASVAPLAGVAHARDLDCKDFHFQEDAQAVFDRDTSDPNRLDEDQGPDDGIACEALPRRGMETVPPVGPSATGVQPVNPSATILQSAAPSLLFRAAAPGRVSAEPSVRPVSAWVSASPCSSEPPWQADTSQHGACAVLVDAAVTARAVGRPPRPALLVRAVRVLPLSR
ncbi:excalibur calcium-binding protein [Streptomyces sp. TLI_105]|uniref:excalibur calcium-binding protein n=1 Tax=Streptomyces sp. TLI_105 TaxID=1881019 RepID=UPI00089B92BC|nr:hypothetical protein SAMN05428939_7811 [Streptomyces sp. TLI_105]